MATSPRTFSVDPWDVLVNVGWGGFDIVVLDVGGRTEVSVAGTTPPPPKAFNMTVTANLPTGLSGPFDPTTPPQIQRFNTGFGSGGVPSTPPTKDEMRPYLIAGGIPSVDISSATDTNSSPDPIYIVTVSPINDAFVILPELIPNPFATEAEAIAWIDGFRDRWPGWAGVDFIVSEQGPGEPRSRTINLRDGSLFFYATRLRSRLTPPPLPGQPRELIINVVSLVAQGGYRLRTYRKSELIDDVEVEVGVFIENDIETFRSTNITFTVNLETMGIAFESGPAQPEP